MSISNRDLQSVFGSDVDEVTFQGWITQFDKAEHPIIQKLLLSFKYYDANAVNKEVVTLRSKIEIALNEAPIDFNRIWFVQVGYVAKSGGLIAYSFRTRNNLPQERFVALADLKHLNVRDGDRFVLLDDFLGSGAQAIDLWSHICSQKLRYVDRCTFYIGLLVAYAAGIEAVEKSTKFKVIANTVLPDTSRALHPAGIFSGDKKLLAKAIKLVRKYGNQIYPEHPEGFKKSQSLLGFSHSTPNNTLPIFWSTRGGWRPSRALTRIAIQAL